MVQESCPVSDLLTSREGLGDKSNISVFLIDRCDSVSGTPDVNADSSFDPSISNSVPYLGNSSESITLICGVAGDNGCLSILEALMLLLPPFRRSLFIGFDTPAADIFVDGRDRGRNASALAPLMTSSSPSSIFVKIRNTCVVTVYS